VEPHNYCVNAAECAIQTFKDTFITALATTNRDCPLQLWDNLAPQVQDTLNLLQTLRTHLDISTYEALNGPYDWNWYPPCTPRVQGNYLQSPGGMGIMGILQHGRMVLGPIQGPLLMQPVLRPQDEGVLYLGFCRTLRTALPGPKSQPECPPESTHGGVKDRDDGGVSYHKKKKPFQTIAHSPQCNDNGPTCPSRTKDDSHRTDRPSGNSTGDRQSGHHEGKRPHS
jgi:hypothetical protein